MSRAALTIAVVLALTLVACGDAPEPAPAAESELTPAEPTPSPPPPEPPSAPAGAGDPTASAETELTGLDRIRHQLDAFGQSRWKALEQEYSAAGEQVVWRITAFDHPPAQEVDTAGYCVRIGKLMERWAPDRGWEAEIEQGDSLLRTCDVKSWKSIYHPQLNPDVPKA